MRLGINDYKKLNNSTYGAEPKTWIEYNNQKYLVKFPKLRDNVETDSVKSEHLASSFINLAGGKSHKTTYIENFEISEGEFKEAVLCKDLMSENTYDRMITFEENTSSISTDIKKHDYFVSDIIHIFKHIHNIDFDEVKNDFWEMVIFDAILGNTDRHSGNWSIFYKDGKRGLTPIYDNAASLLPRAMRTIYGDEYEWLKTRTLVFPNSKIMLDNEEHRKERISYIKLINSGLIPENLLNKYKNLNIDYILNKLKKDNDWLSQKDWLFYYKFIKLRYLVIIKGIDFEKAYKELKNIQNNDLNLNWK